MFAVLFKSIRGKGDEEIHCSIIITYFFTALNIADTGCKHLTL